MAECSRNRDPVVAVDDVVAVRAFYQRDRRQRHSLAVGEGDPLPAIADDFRRRTEAGIELGRGLDRSHDPRERNDLQMRRPSGRRGGVRKGRKLPARPLPDEPSADPRQCVGPARLAEVGLCIEERNSSAEMGQRLPR
jgi:hypothetical protein